MNFEFWRKVMWKVFYKILTVNIEFWLKNEMKSCFLTGFLTLNIEFWRLSEMKSWYIDGFEFDQSLLKTNFSAIFFTNSVRKIDFKFKTKIFQSFRTFTYFCFVTSKFWFYKWIAKLAVRVTRLRFIFSAICQIVPILIYWLYRFKK